MRVDTLSHTSGEDERSSLAEERVLVSGRGRSTECVCVCFNSISLASKEEEEEGNFRKRPGKNGDTSRFLMKNIRPFLASLSLVKLLIARDEEEEARQRKKRRA